MAPKNRALNTVLNTIKTHQDYFSTGFSLIRYDRLAALVILAGDLYDTQMQEEIIHKANLHKIPVIWQGGVHEGCLSIPTDYKDTYA